MPIPLPVAIIARSTRIALVLTSLAAAAAAAQAPSVNHVLDSVARAAMTRGQGVGLVVAVVRGDDTLLHRGYGRANVEWDVPMPADAMFEIGSVTKQFTAAAILQLRDAGKLSLDDEITRWLPDFETRGNTVTLRHLLDHTSGIVGITEMPEFGILVENSRFPRDSGYALIRRSPFQFPTGAAQVYNNSGFWLLGLVIERASGMTYAQYIETRIFTPLGMTRSSYCNPLANVPRRANGYAVMPGLGVRRAATNVHTWPYAAGSLCSTAADLVTWLRALHGGEVLSPQSYAEMITPAKLADGTPLQYGMGVGVAKDVRGNRVFGHGGGIGGFTSHAAWYPDARMAVVTLTNTNGGVNPAALAAELAGTVLPVTVVAATPRPFTGDNAPLVGTYRGPSRGRDMVVVISAVEGGIAASVNGASPTPLVWVEGLTFGRSGATLSFRRPPGIPTGPATELRFDAGSGYYILKRQ